MKSLGDHLGANEKINFAQAKIPEDAPIILLPFQGVGIHPFDASMREEFAEGILDPFCSQAGITNGGIATIGLRAALGGLGGMTTDVAEKPMGRAMIGQGHAAIRTLSDEAALRALQGTGPATAVEKKNHLLAAFQPLEDGFLE
jgi:hypothetical protein